MSNDINDLRATDPWQTWAPPGHDSQIASADKNQDRIVAGAVADTLGHMALPDAVVYTNDALNQPSTRNFVLANPLTGAYTHFVTHKNETVNLHGVPFKHVESVHYDAKGGGTRREDGLGWAQKVGSATMFANMRGGDTNLVNSKNGASVTMGFFGSPAELRGKGGLLEKMKDSPDARMRAMAKGVDVAASVTSAGGGNVGLAWRGELRYDKASKELQVNVSGAKFTLAEFAQSLENMPATNESQRSIAQQNNRAAYLDGANPYEHADKTRTQGGEYRNHGDPVAAIAGGVVQAGHMVNPGLPPVRTNNEARQALEEAIDRDYPALSPDQRRLLGDQVNALRPDRLNDPERKQLRSTLASLNDYDLNFGSQKIEQAAEAAAKAQGTAGQQRDDKQFVRDVFEGDFRTAFAKSYDVGDAARDVMLGANRWLASLSALDGGSTAKDEDYLQKHKAREDGLKARLDALDGSVLDSLGLSSEGLSGKEKAAFERRLLSGLTSALANRSSEQGNAPTAQSLYEAFASLSQEERKSLGARLNASARPASERRFR
jgi:hypothetical protein